MFFYALIDAVTDFHEKIGNRTQKPMPRDPNLLLRSMAVKCLAFSEQLEALIDSPDPRFLRAHLLLEELGETLMGMSEGNELETLDGLTDLLYVLIGATTTFDLPLEEAFWEIHNSNMTKEPQSDDKSRTRVRKKGPNFRPPNLAQVLKEHRNET